MSDKNEFEQMLKRDLEQIALAFTLIPGSNADIAVTHWEEMLRSDDGIGLRTLFYRPQTPDPIPVIVQRGCYPMELEKAKLYGDGLGKLGFGYVYQCCRGTGGSEGDWVPYDYDRADGAVFLNHLQELDWVDSIGYYGRSYLAFTGMVLADILPPKVKSMHLSVYGMDRFESAYKNGLFRQDVLTSWAMNNAGHPVDADYLTSARYRPQIEVDTALWGGKLDWYRDWITHPDEADPYWQEGFWSMLREMPKRFPDIPILIGEGWYDHHLGSALKSHLRISPEKSSNVVLRIGPWNHSNAVALYRDAALENAEENETVGWVLWFIETLKKGIRPKGEVQYYNIGADRWESSKCYPFAAQKNVPFFLSANTLKFAPAENGHRAYDYDPDNPVITWGAESLLATNRTSGGSRMQPAPEWRDDILSFVSEPLEESLNVLGRIRAHLFVESSAEDTCFTIKLMEVFPDGKAYNIRNGIGTLAYRENATERKNYEGGIVELEISTWDIAWQLQKGSRLRLDISSSNFPEYSIHPNFAGVWSQIGEAQIAHQRVYFGEENPSCVILPARDGN